MLWRAKHRVRQELHVQQITTGCGNVLTGGIHRCGHVSGTVLRLEQHRDGAGLLLKLLLPNYFV